MLPAPCFLGFVLVVFVAAMAGQAYTQATYDAKFFNALRWRSIGPNRFGRSFYILNDIAVLRQLPPTVARAGMLCSNPARRIVR